MIYLPNEITNQNCAYIYNENIIRVYDEKPIQPGQYTYTDYYIHFDYNTKSSTSQFSQYSTYPDCLPNSNFTTNYFYRIDIDKILVSVIILLIICFLFPYKIISRIFGRWLKL